MRKLLDAVIAAPVGFVVAGFIGLLVGSNPIFYRDDAASAVFFVAALGGAVAGAVGAASGKTPYVVAVLTGSLFALLGIFGSPFIVISLGTVGVSIAAAVAGFLGMKIGRTINMRVATDDDRSAGHARSMKIGRTINMRVALLFLMVLIAVTVFAYLVLGLGKGSVYQRGDGRWVGRISLGLDAQGRRRQSTVYALTSNSR